MILVTLIDFFESKSENLQSSRKIIPYPISCIPALNNDFSASPNVDTISNSFTHTGVPCIGLIVGVAVGHGVSV